MKDKEVTGRAKSLLNLRPNQSRYKTAKDFDAMVNKYFNDCEIRKKPPTVAGLAYALGFNSRRTLLNYEDEEKHKDLSKKDKEAIIEIIKRARLRIETHLEEHLLTGKQVAGTIFNLKNNFGYVDKTEQENKNEILINISGIDKL